MTVSLPLADQLGHSTVRIECTLADGRKSTGTGFFFRFLDNGDNHVPVIVTNKHVVAGATAGKFLVHGLGADGQPATADAIWVELGPKFDALWIPHPDPLVDLCIMPIAPLLRKASEAGMKPFYVALSTSLVPTAEEFDQFVMVEDVLMVGYPNGLWDSYNHMPLMRRGISATHPGRRYEGRPEFVIDAACFPGSSGSPVLLYNVGSYCNRDGGTVIGSRVKLLGVLYAGPQFTAEGKIVVTKVPTTNVPLAITSLPFNLGFVIRSTELLQFEPLLEARRAAKGA